MSPAALERLVGRSARSNAKAGITGLLVYATIRQDSSGMFAQWIEGPAGAVHALYRRIQGDARHTHCEVIYDGPIETVTGQDARRFEEWAMHGEVKGLGSFPVSAHEFLKRAPACDRRLLATGYHRSIRRPESVDR